MDSSITYLNKPYNFIRTISEGNIIELCFFRQLLIQPSSECVTNNPSWIKANITSKQLTRTVPPTAWLASLCASLCEFRASFSTDSLAFQCAQHLSPEITRVYFNVKVLLGFWARSWLSRSVRRRRACLVPNGPGLESRSDHHIFHQYISPSTVSIHSPLFRQLISSLYGSL